MIQVQPSSGIKHSVSPDFTLAHMTQLIMPQHANSLGITFGGQVTCYISHTPSSSNCVLQGWTLVSPLAGHAVDGAMCIHCCIQSGQGRAFAYWRHGCYIFQPAHPCRRCHVHHCSGTTSCVSRLLNQLMHQCAQTRRQHTNYSTIR